MELTALMAVVPVDLDLGLGLGLRFGSGRSVNVVRAEHRRGRTDGVHERDGEQRRRIGPAGKIYAVKVRQSFKYLAF